MARVVVRVPLWAAAVTALALSLTVRPVAAHAELTSATPGPGDEVRGSPDEVVARFSQDLVESRSRLEVRDATGAAVARGGKLGADRREIRLALPELPAGKYEVRYVTYSAEDGELHRDTYGFTVIEEPIPSSTTSPTPTASATPTASMPRSPSLTPVPSEDGPSPTVTGSGASSESSVLVAIVAALVLVGALGTWLVRRRST